MLNTIIIFTILIISIIVHEVAHGYVALKFGDPTAKNLGRLTANPVPHIDILGSLLLPAILILSNTGFFIGWAKPVPINTRNLRNPIHDMMWIAFAGPLSNFSIAILCSLLLKLVLPIMAFGGLSVSVIKLLQIFCYYTIQINLFLAVFNLIPIPPLDGSRILLHFLPTHLHYGYQKLEPYGFVIIFGLAYFGFFGPILFLLLKPFFIILL